MHRRGGVTVPGAWARFGQLMAGPDTSGSFEVLGAVEDDRSVADGVIPAAEARFEYRRVYYSQPGTRKNRTGITGPEAR